MSPLPVSLSPDGDIHHGPLHGDKPGKTRARLPTRYRHARTPPPWRGRSAEGAGGVGGASRRAWVSFAEGAGGVGAAEGVCGYLLPAKAQAGWGLPAESVWVSFCEGAGGVGAAGRECLDIPVKARVG